MGRLAELLKEVEREAEEEPKAPIDARNLFDEKFKKVGGASPSLTLEQFMEVFHELNLNFDRVEAQELFDAFAARDGPNGSGAALSIEDAHKALAHCSAHEDSGVKKLLKSQATARGVELPEYRGRKSSIVTHDKNMDADRDHHFNMGQSHIISVSMENLPTSGCYAVLLYIEGANGDWGGAISSTECSKQTASPIFIRCFLVGDKCQRRLRAQVCSCTVKKGVLVPELNKCQPISEYIFTMSDLLRAPNQTMKEPTTLVDAKAGPSAPMLHLYATQYADSAEGLVDLTLAVQNVRPIDDKNKTPVCFVQLLRRHASGDWLPIAQSLDADMKKTPTPAWRFQVPVIDLSSDTKNPLHDPLSIKVWQRDKQERVQLLAEWHDVLPEGEHEFDMTRADQSGNMLPLAGHLLVFCTFTGGAFVGTVSEIHPRNASM